MESKQSTQMIAWLDEERRKDKALIVKLEERVAAQAALVEDQARRVQALEGQLVAVRTTSLSVNTFDESVSRLRTEVTAALDQVQTRSADQDIRKFQDMIRDSTNKAIEDLRQDILTRLERELQPRRAEEERLSRVAVELQNYADTLSKNLEEFQRTLSFLEEQRRQDSRRISDISGVQAESGKKVEGASAKLELLEEIARRNERGVADLSATVVELRQQRQSTMEQDAIADRQREKLVSDTVRKIDDGMKKFEKNFEQWTETARSMKKQVGDFDRLADRVERRLNEVAEIQRLSEERFRKEWEEFQQEGQKSFRQFTLTNDESWRESNKILAALSEKVTALTETADQLAVHLNQLSAAQHAAVEGLMATFQTFREQVEPSKPARARAK